MTDPNTSKSSNSSIATLEARVREARDELTLDLRKMNAEFPTDGDWHLDAELSGTAAVVIGKEIARWFKDDVGAPNYVEMKMMDPETREVFVLTVQRANGKTPHELRVEAEAKIAAAEALGAAKERQRVWELARLSDGADTFWAAFDAETP